METIDSLRHALRAVAWEGLPVWILAVLAAVVVALAVDQWRRLRRKVPAPSRGLLTALRVLALAFLLVFLLNPSMLLRWDRALPVPVAVLIDTSQSMGIGSAQGSRLDQATTLLHGGGTRSLVQRLADGYEATLYTFGDASRKVTAARARGLTADGHRSDLQAAIGEALGSGSGPGTPSAVVILSDGRVEGAEAATALLRSRGVPAVVVPLGSPSGYRDVWVEEVQAPRLAFRGKAFTVDAVVRAHGFTGHTVPVILTRDDKVMGQQRVMLTADPRGAVASFRLVPDTLGDHRLVVTVPPQAGEALTANNSVSVPVRVHRDKIRIMMVSGSPSWGYRFFRSALKRDPTIDLLSFVILRTPENRMNVPLSEQSLIPFPVDTLFTKELPNFDLLILDNFAPSVYLTPGYLQNIRQFVEEGGALAMFGGRRAFADGGYAGTPVADVLPVALAPDALYRSEEARAHLTRAGALHPLARLSSDAAENERLWKAMPRIGGFNAVTAGPRGIVLVDAETPTGRSPLIAVGQAGRGRTLAVMSDFLYAWNIEMVGKGMGNHAYQRLVNQMIRWLSRDPGLNPVGIAAPDDVTRPGSAAQIRVTVRDEDFTRAHQATVRMTVVGPDGKDLPVTPVAGEVPGEFVATVTPPIDGPYRVRVEALVRGQRVGSNETTLTAAFSRGEMRDGTPEPEVLARMAEATSGRVVPAAPDAAGEVVAALDEITRDRRPLVTEERRIPLWNTLPAFGTVLVLLSAEWFLRRRWGLL